MNSSTESVVYRRPFGTERGLTSLPSTNSDGRVAFNFTELNPADADGPASFYVATPDAPATATPLSLPYRRAGMNWFASDGNTLVYVATETGVPLSRQELYAVGTLTPASAPMKVSKTLATDEQLAGVYVARGGPRVVLGYQTPAPSDTSQLFLWNVGSAAASQRLIASDYRPGGFAGPSLDDRGLFFAYTALVGSKYVLRVLSTQAQDYSVPVSGPTGQLGIIQYRWLPQP